MINDNKMEKSLKNVLSQNKLVIKSKIFSVNTNIAKLSKYINK